MLPRIELYWIMKGVSFVSEAIKGTNRLVQKSCKRAMNNTFLDHPESLFGISTSLRRMYKKAQFCYLPVHQFDTFQSSVAFNPPRPRKFHAY